MTTLWKFHNGYFSVEMPQNDPLALIVGEIKNGNVEMPDLTDYYRKRFETEAKEQEYNALVIQ